MGDFDKIADELTTKAALAASKGAAKRAVGGLLSGDGEKAEEDAEAKAKRNKRLAYAALALLVVVGAIGLVLSYWHWFLLAGLGGFAGLYGYGRIRKRMAGKANEAALEKPAPTTKARVKDEPPPRVALDDARLEREARARNEARAIEESAAEQRDLDDELAAMKARLDK